ncbi:MAG: hypothetical protein HYR72_20085 [Deltaproteobacteria bacterium]|nr:hypothetical protein [Deltaproteobacteria bacterium]MBI3390822.1 hypothetical protein [Deltaproteobacteria bacterium]
MRTRLPQHIKRLRVELDRRLAKYPIYRYVVTDILWHLDQEIWESEQGIPSDTAHILDSSLSPEFDAVLRATTEAEINKAVDALVRAWEAALPDRWG